MLLRSRTVRLGRVGAAITLLAATLGGSYTASTHAARAKTPVTLTFWSWVTNHQLEVNLFEQSHPGIKVNLVNAGANPAEYIKLRTALTAGSGAPDVVQIEYQELPTFELTGKLVDLAQYGANQYKNEFVPWAWGQVSQGAKVYAMPTDSGPMALLYRADIFAKYHLAVPATWAQFQQDAIALHKANPQLSLTDFPPSDGSWVTAMLWQAGVRPFKVNGATISIDVNSPRALKVVNYWGDMVKAGVIQSSADFTTPWFTALANGTLASWVTAGWAPNYLSTLAIKSAGKWRAAPIPQWTAGADASANYGGASDAVTTQSQHPKEAAELAIWLNTNPQSTTILANQQYQFPPTKAILNSASFLNASSAFYGGQQVHRVFADASHHVDTSFQWSPFQDYVYAQFSNDLGNAVNGKTSYTAAMNTLQSNLVSYAKAQGFTVK